MTALSVEVRLPPPHFASGVLAVLSPGGGYPCSVLDLHVPGHPDYSLADALVARGHAVALVDIAGTAPHVAERGDAVTMSVAAAALDATARELALPGVRVKVGIGHSLGAGVTAAAQAAHGSFDAVALLGYSPRWCSLPVPVEGRAATLAALRDRDPALWAGEDVVFPRSADDDFGYLPDVPAAVRAAAEERTLPVPRGLAVDFGMPGPALAAARAIRCPVLLVLGAPDASAAPAEEPALYASSSRVELVQLRGSAHNHHLSAVRGELWDALDRLLRSTARDTEHEERRS